MNEKEIRIVSVDFQKEFSALGGKHYRPHPNVVFIKDTLIPFLRKNKINIAEIISDYRQPRPGDKDDSCRPGETGYESEIPADISLKPIWIKCMNSPIWTRENIGESVEEPGLPYEDPVEFGNWLEKVVGKPSDVEVVLIGLTIDCCVLCTSQELTMKGYKVFVLKEGVDPYSGSQKEKEEILNGPVLRNWAEVISWVDLEKKLIK